MTLGDPPTDANRELSEAAKHGILASDLRQQLLGELLQEGTNTEIALAELAARIATDRRQRKVEVELHHVHLPKLEAADLVEYDPVEELVSTNPALQEFDSYL